ncbi:membrane protein insertion efficiency factor YidD [Pseudomonas syringae]|uniref:membrane protein insertion efficiency factor YidD n=1 Tax=Pseudomonas syringae TaxID=317 RepID=UPI0009B44492|nr:membrane protein insertion efficiency factor YidD [Pseudomonas syringae]
MAAIRWCQRVAAARLTNAYRFGQTCSNSAITAIEKHGVANGCLKAAGRICRCRYPNGGQDLP